jgi:hypothetical protein
MAWIFSLSVECGTEQSQAEQFAEHFRDIIWTIDNGIESQCQADIFTDVEGNWWCRVCPSGLSEIGIDAPESAYIMTELGILLYQRLRSAPSFRYGIVGVEVDEFRTYSELIDDSLGERLRQRTVASLPGIVLAQDIWQLLGSSPILRSFSTGYFWKPYEGEVYKPLVTSFALKNKMSELLMAA